MVPVMMEICPECFVALGTTRPRPYAANGPAQRIAKANVFIVTILIPKKEMNTATAQQIMLQILVALTSFMPSRFFPEYGR